MARKANMNELHELHRLIAEYYAEAIQSGEDLSSGTLAAINTFLDQRCHCTLSVNISTLNKFKKLFATHPRYLFIRFFIILHIR